MPQYRSQTMEVVRRFRDFDWLHQRLVEHNRGGWTRSSRAETGMLLLVQLSGCWPISNRHLHASLYVHFRTGPNLIATVSCRHHHSSIAGEGRHQKVADAAWILAAASGRA